MTVFTNLLNIAKDPSCFEGLAFINLLLAISCAFITPHQFIREESRVCSTQLLASLVAIRKFFRSLQRAHSFEVIWALNQGFALALVLLQEHFRLFPHQEQYATPK